MRLLTGMLVAFGIACLIWVQYFKAPDHTPVGRYAFPAGAAAALLDGRPRRGEHYEDPDFVICLFVSGRELAEVLPLRRHDRSKVVSPRECEINSDGQVIHRPTGAHAGFLSYSEFQPTGTERGTATVNFHCDPLCGGTWTVELSGADDIGWWVVEENNLVIY